MFAMSAFGWLGENKRRKSLQVSLVAGTDNRANESLSVKRATTKWPLMAINMQLSALLSKARVSLHLNWRPREENTEADDLTNERFADFDPSLRVAITYGDLQLDVLRALVDAHGAFEDSKRMARESKRTDSGIKSKRFDKTPW